MRASGRCCACERWQCHAVASSPCVPGMQPVWPGRRRGRVGPQGAGGRPAADRAAVEPAAGARVLRLRAGAGVGRARARRRVARWHPNLALLRTPGSHARRCERLERAGYVWKLFSGLIWRPWVLTQGEPVWRARVPRVRCLACSTRAVQQPDAHTRCRTSSSAAACKAAARRHPKRLRLRRRLGRRGCMGAAAAAGAPGGPVAPRARALGGRRLPAGARRGGAPGP